MHLNSFFELEHFTIGAEVLFSLLRKKTLFQARWGFVKGTLSQDEYENTIRLKALPALKRLRKMILECDLLEPRAALGFFRCRLTENEICVHDESGTAIARFSFNPHRLPMSSKNCSTDFSSFGRAANIGIVGLWAATIGKKSVEALGKLYESKSYADYHMLHGLAAELTDCMAEHIQRRAANSFESKNEFCDGYTTAGRLVRISPGYPAMPDLEDQKSLLKILDAGRIGIAVNDSLQMEPEYSVSGVLLIP